MPGLFVTLDGPGGAGKSTLTRLLGERLAAAGHPVHITRQPSDGPLGTLARHQTATYSGTALACLVAADRYHHLDTEIGPALTTGAVVVCDRYVAASYVLQTRDGVPLDYLRHLNARATRPDLAVLVTADPRLLEERLTTRGAHSRFEHTGSSAIEARLYEETAAVLIEDGFPPYHRIDTGTVAPEVAAAAIIDRISRLSSRG
ncbi:hypothetical protein GCM10010156_48520 [Planobispora rosea]|uniref:Thymidylate kinase n=1 Tax=Planobispora rosea TaxID=35762 RepID=A0A8J3S3C5_PLARO|nr:dTMP kinase [Planobispora rosea]GGS84227.1 hypothetical protein GCM10010156_48520 [Planobispora rosea]GIH86363.1 hypothetical protein Pro02_47710 [Planobispora rosea]